MAAQEWRSGALLSHTIVRLLGAGGLFLAKGMAQVSRSHAAFIDAQWRVHLCISRLCLSVSGTILLLASSAHQRFAYIL